LRVEEAQKNPITLTSGEKEWTISPDSVGTKVDVPTTVERPWLRRGKGNFLSTASGLRHVLQGQADNPRGSVDQAKMKKVLGNVYEALDVPPSTPAWCSTGKDQVSSRARRAGGRPEALPSSSRPSS